MPKSTCYLINTFSNPARLRQGIETSGSGFVLHWGQTQPTVACPDALGKACTPQRPQTLLGI